MTDERMTTEIKRDTAHNKVMIHESVHTIKRTKTANIPSVVANIGITCFKFYFSTKYFLFSCPHAPLQSLLTWKRQFRSLVFSPILNCQTIVLSRIQFSSFSSRKSMFQHLFKWWPVKLNICKCYARSLHTTHNWMEVLECHIGH